MHLSLQIAVEFELYCQGQELRYSLQWQVLLTSNSI
jgi:hypothetical protein